ncbi:hypothetical protein H6G97_20940 [Nostoc flagelliforme FACHB-838]|uniref:Uncharacterized protein n=1 Tax=Nostoc flagelliforme FACHB-838 TaxID=2692904 RepID=A0ABR8DR29_9NOSO|nr:hypothetical protein [Nostoc flagelliforme]MBD2531917.1 hypothetical protein [Nostoc flagelliforme FACHB-838]
MQPTPAIKPSSRRPSPEKLEVTLVTSVCSLSAMMTIAVAAMLFAAGQQPSEVQPSTSSSPSSLGGVKGKGEEGKVLNPLPLTPSPLPSPHPAFLGWQTTKVFYCTESRQYGSDKHSWQSSVIREKGKEKRRKV